MTNNYDNNNNNNNKKFIMPMWALIIYTVTLDIVPIFCDMI